ncbi:TPA: Crp/Fnr family transcriptional regulator, partial [Citrobacter sedlakii]
PFYDGRKPVEITAITSCIAKRLYKTDFLSWLQSDFEATKFLIKELANKLIINAELVEHILSLTVKERLLRSILMHYRRDTLQNLTKANLSKEINTPIRSLNRAISTCENEGIISYSNNTFLIKDMTQLQKSVPYL